MSNINMSTAKSVKNDEFYTKETDIEKEMMHYTDFFKGKKVLCNCNDGRQSNFYKFFTENFARLGLMKLTCISHSFTENGTVYEFYGNKETENVITLRHNGDFRDNECIAFLNECDVVVTNPPFSMFRDLISLIFEFDKKFIVIGNDNERVCKDIFPLFRDGKMWHGVNHIKEFGQPDGTYKSFGNISWFTNIEHDRMNLPIQLTKKYNPKEYPKFDNYNAIECGKVADIPMDYDGIIAVPLTYISKHCPTQFEIVGLACGCSAANNFGERADYVRHPNDRGGVGVINGNRVYARILIKKLKHNEQEQ